MKVETNINTSNPSGVQTSQKNPIPINFLAHVAVNSWASKLRKSDFSFYYGKRHWWEDYIHIVLSVNWIINIYKPLNVTVAWQSGRILSIWSGSGQFFVPSSHHVHFIIIKHFIMLWAYVCLYLIRKKAKWLRSMRKERVNHNIINKQSIGESKIM